MTNVHFRTSSGDYLCAEAGGGQEINATRTQAAEWETFGLELHDAAGKVTANIQAYNKQFVCAEGGGGGEVNANRDQASTWETFELVGLTGTDVKGGETVHLRTSDAIHYVCAEGGGGGQVNATRDQAGPWETFIVELGGAENPRLQMPDPVHLDLGLGHHMETSFRTSPDGAVRATTTLTCTNKLIGFTAGAQVMFVDKQGKSLGSSEIGQWGIDQAPVIGAAHRTIDWFASAPAGTDDIALNQFWAPKSRFNEIVVAVKTIAETIVVVVEFVETFCKTYPAICAAAAEGIKLVFSSSNGGDKPAN